MVDDDSRTGAFLCHSSGDRDRVRTLYERLRQDGVECWLDTEDLAPGVDWRREIHRALRRSRYVLACLSGASVTKTGFVQSELRQALEIAQEHPDGDTYVIPVRLEDCPIPDSLQRWQAVDVFLPGQYARLARTLGGQSGDATAFVRDGTADSVFYGYPLRGDPDRNAPESEEDREYADAVHAAVTRAWVTVFGTAPYTPSRPDSVIRAVFIAAHDPSVKLVLAVIAETRSLFGAWNRMDELRNVIRGSRLPGILVTESTLGRRDGEGTLGVVRWRPGDDETAIETVVRDVRTFYGHRL